MIIQSVELVTQANALSFENKVYHAYLDNGEELDLFQQYDGVYLPPESLVGLTPEAAQQKRALKMTAATYGANRLVPLMARQYMTC